MNKLYLEQIEFFISAIFEPQEIPIVKFSFVYFIKNHAWFSPSLLDIDVALLKKRGIHGLILDFDGVLSSVDQIFPTAEIHAWLEKFMSQDFPLAIHSNNPLYLEKKRKDAFSLKYPKILWLSSHPKKPSPLAIKKASKLWSCPVESLAMVDDRLLTGGKAAAAAGAQFIYITNPFKDFRLHLWKEVGCIVLRWIERVLYGIPQKSWKKIL